MLALILAVTLALPQEPGVLDVPVYQDARWGVAMPRPFDDWIFAPATERGTTTVIFQPRAGALSDQLWGALVLSPWGREVPLAEVAQQRHETWRAMLGASFSVLSRDSLEVAGLPAIHAVMSGVIARAVLEVEEYLIARGTDLIVLQFRYPRGVPRDSIAAGFTRTLQGLRLGDGGRPLLASPPLARAPAPPPGPAPSGGRPSWSARIELGQVVFDLPEGVRAIAPGWLTSEVSSGGRRTMRFTTSLGEPDTTLYAVGRFTADARRVGRLTVRIWRSSSADPTIARAGDSTVARAAQAWATYWRAFGPVPTTELTLVETAWSETHGAAAILYLGADASDPHVIRRELARTWWGGAVRDDAGSLVSESLPEWATTLFGDRPQGSAVEEARRLAGDARFREAIRTFVYQSRGGPPAVADLLRVLGDSAAAPIRTLTR